MDLPVNAVRASVSRHFRFVQPGAPEISRPMAKLGALVVSCHFAGEEVEPYSGRLHVRHYDTDSICRESVLPASAYRMGSDRG